jgi:hypothetical protein
MQIIPNLQFRDLLKEILKVLSQSYAVNLKAIYKKCS